MAFGSVLLSNTGEQIIKNTAEQTIKQSSEAAIKQASEAAIRQASEAAIKQAIESATKQATEQILRDSTERLLKEATEKYGKELTSEMVENISKAAAKEAGEAGVKESTEKFLKEATERMMREAAEKYGKNIPAEILENIGKNAVKEASEKAAKEAADNAAKKQAKEAAEALAKTEIKQIEGGLFRTIANNKKMLAVFVTAAAFGAYALTKFMEKNMFEMKITKITKKNTTLNNITTALGITENKSDVLVIEVEPVDPKKEMIELVKGAEIEIKTISTTPSLAKMKLKISDIYDGIPNRFEVKITNVPNYEKLKIDTPNSGLCTYITNVGLEAKAIIKGGTKSAVEEGKDIIGGGNNLIADLLGVDPDMMKLIIIFIILIVAYIYLRPIISLFMPKSQITTGGNCQNQNGGCDCAL